MPLLTGGLIAGLIQKATNGVKTLVSNARVGKQVLASGATVQTTATGSGTSTIVSPGGNVQLPVWIWWLFGGVLLLAMLYAVVKSLFKKR